ncbi:MAG TPA: type II toxin-antitoxin system ParD family antitoxin [Geminicoccaceae bacterium]|jgi:antitoxin ParD1/3/4|nr:type II toxin-antitoxin system ParD family antitoxin [Geminicoccaceae bacterium]
MQTVEKLSVTLPRELAEKVREKVAKGEYASQSALIRAALRLWQEREELKERRLADLRAKIDRSLDDPNPPLEEDAAFAYLEEHFGER